MNKTFEKFDCFEEYEFYYVASFYHDKETIFFIEFLKENVSAEN